MHREVGRSPTWLVAPLPEPAEVDSGHGSAGSAAGDLFRGVLRDRDAESLPVPALVVAARTRTPGAGLSRDAGPARGHRRRDHPAAAGQALVGLPEPVPLAAHPVDQARARASLGVRARLLGAGPAHDRVPQHAELVPLAMVVPLNPPLPGLRGDRFHPPAHRDEAAGHQVRPPGEARRRRRTDRGSVEREPAGAQQRRNGSAAGDAGDGPARPVRRRRLRDRSGRAHHGRPDRHAALAHRAARDQAGLQGSAGGPGEQDRQVGARSHPGHGRRLAPRGDGPARRSP